MSLSDIVWWALFIMVGLVIGGVWLNHRALRELHAMLNSRLDGFIEEARNAADAASKSAYQEGFHAGRVERALNDSVQRLERT